MSNSRFPRGSVYGSANRFPRYWRLPWALLLLALFANTTLAQRGAQTAPAPLDQLVESSATILRGHVIVDTVDSAQPPSGQAQDITLAVVNCP